MKRLRPWLREILIAAIAFLIALPFTWVAIMIFDNTPPHERISGEIRPAMLYPGQGAQVIWRNTSQKRMCRQGYVRREFIDSQRVVWEKEIHEAVAGKGQPSDLPVQKANPEERLIPPDITIPEKIALGPAIYRVTTYWYCNWLQRVLDRPIEREGPDLHFVVVPPPVAPKWDLPDPPR